MPAISFRGHGTRRRPRSYVEELSRPQAIA